MQYSIYALALAVSISTWFIVIRAPLWLDETVSMFLIKGGWAGHHASPGLAGLPGVLLPPLALDQGDGHRRAHAPDLVGSSHAGARSICFTVRHGNCSTRTLPLIAAIVFCLHPIIIFAAIDVRPYAFAALVINAAILALVRLTA